MTPAHTVVPPRCPLGIGGGVVGHECGVGAKPSRGDDAVFGQERVRDVDGEQRAGAESAREVETVERRRGSHARSHSHRSVEGAGHHDGQTDLVGQPQYRTHAAEGCHLEHRDVGSVRGDDPHRVGDFTDRLVGGNRYLDRTTHLGQLVDGRTRLFRVLDVADRTDRRDRLRHRPLPVGVDPDPRYHGASCRNTVDVVGQRLPGLGHLHLGCRRSRVTSQDVGDLVGGDGRHRRVQRNGVTLCGRRSEVGGFDAGRQPRRRLLVVVLDERTELAPSRRTTKDQRLAAGDTAEPCPHRQRDDPRGLEDLLDRGQR